MTERRYEYQLMQYRYGCSGQQMAKELKITLETPYDSEKSSNICGISIPYDGLVKLRDILNFILSEDAKPTNVSGTFTAERKD